MLFEITLLSVKKRERRKIRVIARDYCSAVKKVEKAAHKETGVIWRHIHIRRLEAVAEK